MRMLPRRLRRRKRLLIMINPTYKQDALEALSELSKSGDSEGVINLIEECIANALQHVVEDDDYNRMLEHIVWCRTGCTY